MKVDIIYKAAKIIYHDRNNESGKSLLAEPAISRPVSVHFDGASAVGHTCGKGKKLKSLLVLGILDISKDRNQSSMWHSRQSPLSANFR